MENRYLYQFFMICMKMKVPSEKKHTFTLKTISIKTSLSKEKNNLNNRNIFNGIKWLKTPRFSTESPPHSTNICLLFTKTWIPQGKKISSTDCVAIYALPLISSSVSSDFISAVPGDFISNIWQSQGARSIECGGRGRHSFVDLLQETSEATCYHAVTKHQNWQTETSDLTEDLKWFSSRRASINFQLDRVVRNFSGVSEEECLNPFWLVLSLAGSKVVSIRLQ